ncbi:hypothetical protein [Demequina sp. NBRC 110057]|uniref:hypothetical protein n=1 Tax=Demequina sp. NBRC 110057 TaxID=1570346 RepID=UPI001178C2AC|nr:hypothetical protein [Demequina sp. NBRC 110057]
MPDKKTVELAYAERVREAIGGIRVNPREKPDFELVMPDSRTWGLEVTEAFLSETHARSVKHRDFLRRTHHGRPLSKDDRKQTEEVEVVVTSPTGGLPMHQARGLVTSNSASADPFQVTESEHALTIARAIEKKTDKAPSYDHYPAYLLGVATHLSFGPMTGAASFPPALREALASSPFAEIYVMEHARESGFSPLRQRMLELDYLNVRSLVQRDLPPRARGRRPEWWWVERVLEGIGHRGVHVDKSLRGASVIVGEASVGTAPRGEYLASAPPSDREQAVLNQLVEQAMETMMWVALRDGRRALAPVSVLNE